MTTINFSNFVVDKSEIIENPSVDTKSFDIHRDVYPRLKKFTPKVSSSINLKTEKYRKGL